MAVGRDFSGVIGSKKARQPRSERYERQTEHCAFVGELRWVDTRPPPIDPVGTGCEQYLTPKKSGAIHYMVDLDGHLQQECLDFLLPNQSHQQPNNA